MKRAQDQFFLLFVSESDYAFLTINHLYGFGSYLCIVYYFSTVINKKTFNPIGMHYPTFHYLSIYQCIKITFYSQKWNVIELSLALFNGKLFKWSTYK